MIKIGAIKPYIKSAGITTVIIQKICYVVRHYKDTSAEINLEEEKDNNLQCME